MMPGPNPPPNLHLLGIGIESEKFVIGRTKRKGPKSEIRQKIQPFEAKMLGFHVAGLARFCAEEC